MTEIRIRRHPGIGQLAGTGVTDAITETLKPAKDRDHDENSKPGKP
jgi:hypothetical protein